MRAAEGVYVEWVDDEAVVLNPDTGRVHYLNTSAALFYALVLEHGFDRALQEVASRFDTAPDSAEMKALIDNLLAEALLEA